MSKNLNIINVVDIEATCWEDYPPPTQQSEIIEVGIVTLDATKRNKKLQQKEQISSDDIIVENKQSFLIKPIVSEVSEFCTKLTTITPEMVADGHTYEYVCECLRKQYKSKDRTWASYGDYDQKMFQKQCRRHIGYPFGQRHINIKNIFAHLMGLPKEVGMPTALQMIGERIDGTHHRGHDDAENIAKILKWILLK